MVVEGIEVLSKQKKIPNQWIVVAWTHNKIFSFLPTTKLLDSHPDKYFNIQNSTSHLITFSFSSYNQLNQRM